MLNIYVVGCGGIGGFLCELLPMAIASASLDVIENETSHEVLESLLAQPITSNIPCLVDRLTLIDGDTFNARNALRQGAGAGSKLFMRMQAFSESMLSKTFLRNMQLCGYNKYVTPNNMAEIIPKVAQPNASNSEAWSSFAPCANKRYYPSEDFPVVVLAVDNAKTRYEISKYAEGFDNCLVLNGGNDRTTGHVTVYERRGGKALDPNIMDIYPNIRPDVDKRPDEVECGAVAPKHDQIAITNSIIANAMAALLVRFIKTGTIDQTDKKGRIVRKNEVLIDIDRLSMSTMYHPIS